MLWAGSRSCSVVFERRKVRIAAIHTELNDLLVTNGGLEPEVSDAADRANGSESAEANIGVGNHEP